jgi:hypothetical protein
MRAAGVAIVFGTAALCFTAAPNVAAMELLGQAGVLGEWELTGNLVEAGAGARQEFSGRLKMTHVGICSVDGPEERAGEIRLRLLGSQSHLSANLVLDGVPCSYSARKTHAYEGTMSCTGRGPVPLLLWLR